MNHYEVFVQVVKAASFSAAAKTLHRSPSAISKLIAQLEQRLDVQLFERSTRSLKLTEAGHLYHDRAVEIVRRIRDAETELKEFSGEAAGKLRITFPNALSSSPIIPILSQFANNHPKVVFDINVSIEKKKLIEDDFDFAFRLGALEDSGMVGIKLFDIEPAFAAKLSLVQTLGKPKSVRELGRYTLLVPYNIPFAKLLPMQEMEEDGRSQPVIHTGVDIATFLNLASSGFGACFCFKHMLAAHEQTNALVDITPPGMSSPVPVHLVYQHYQHMPAKHRRFIDTFKAAFRNEG